MPLFDWTDDWLATIPEIPRMPNLQYSKLWIFTECEAQGQQGIDIEAEINAALDSIGPWPLPRMP